MVGMWLLKGSKGGEMYTECKPDVGLNVHGDGQEAENEVEMK